LALLPDRATHVQVIVDASVSAFEVYGRADDNATSDFTLHASGRIARASAVKPPIVMSTCSLDAARARCPEVRDVEEAYARLSAAGFDYGAAFRGVRQLWIGRQTALARVTLPDGLTASGWLSHPALADACLQAIAMLLDSDGVTYVPVGIDRIRLRA